MQLTMFVTDTERKLKKKLQKLVKESENHGLNNNKEDIMHGRKKSDNNYSRRGRNREKRCSCNDDYVLIHTYKH